jgi:hypothetical protein
MNYDCEYCNKSYSTKWNLANHQKTAKQCIKIQNQLDNIKNETLSFSCEYCVKSFTSKHRLNKHVEVCLEKYIFFFKNKEEEYKNLLDENKIKQDIINKLEIENNILKEQINKDDPHKYISELQDKLQQVAFLAIEQKNDVISSMVKKQPREKFACSNVIYILTTPSLKKDKRYILGKAKNLTNRLSTYNKTEEHEIIFYQECDDEEIMNLLEPLVFKKLEDYREQANRERFILPETKNINFFIDKIKECVKFLK